MKPVKSYFTLKSKEIMFCSKNIKPGFFMTVNSLNFFFKNTLVTEAKKLYFIYGTFNLSW